MSQQPAIDYDYGISSVRYDDVGGHIDRVMVHKLEGQEICCDGCEWRRLDVVHRLNKGVSFVTLPRRKRGGLRFGQTVSVWDERFIRSIPNKRTSDNLANLPPILSYGISKVHHNSGNTHLERVLVHKVERHLDPKIGDARVARGGITICCDGCVWRRRDVVHRIAEGDSFATLPKAESGSAVKIFRRKFIRSTPKKEVDNLAKLPPISKAELERQRGLP